MMNIPRYIAHLLYYHDCVIVPGLGGFVCNYKPAFYDADEGYYYPPGKEVAFNVQLDRNDGLLLNFIVTREGLDYADARRQVEDFTFRAKEDLKQGKNLELPGIGLLKMKSGTLNFEPENAISGFAESYGLSVLRLPVDGRPMRRAVFSPPAGSRKAVVSSLLAIPFLVALALIPGRLQQDDPYRSSAYTTFRTVFRDSNRLYFLNNPDSVASAVDQMTDKRNALYYAYVTVTSTVAEQPVPDTTSKKTDVKEEVVVKENPVVAEANYNNRFFIIAGSFEEMYRAENYCRELNGKGFQTEIVKRDGKLRISVGGYANGDQANAGMSAFRQAHPEMTVWLLAI